MGPGGTSTFEQKQCTQTLDQKKSRSVARECGGASGHRGVYAGARTCR